jgi:hypothetical protein
MNGYIFFYGSARVEIHADSLYQAKQKAAAYFKVKRNKEHMVHGMLAEKNGVQVTHSTSSL